MKVVKLSVLFLPLLVAIAASPASAETKTLKFQCQEGGSFSAQVQDDKARITFDSGKSVKLLPVDSAVGQKFSDGRTLLHVNGDEAFVEVNYQRVSNQCLSQHSSSTVSSHTQQ